MRFNFAEKIQETQTTRKTPYDEYHLACLDGNDVISARVSDHHPVVHNQVLFWNVMMKAGRRGNGSSYNNAFSMIEDHHQYRARISKIAQVIAEIVYVQIYCLNRSIFAITLCEGPINEQAKQLFNCLKKFPWMKYLTSGDNFHKPSSPHADDWGLLMLADARYSVKKISHPLENDLKNKLANRFQIWQLQKNNAKKYVTLAHFPFSGDEKQVEQSQLSLYGKQYCYLIATVLQRYANYPMLFCADFNINPYLITEYKHRILDKIPNSNSVLTGSQPVTVDGILLSNRQKQISMSRNISIHFFPNVKSIRLGSEIQPSTPIRARL